MFAYDINNFDFDSHIDDLIDMAKSIEPDKITILTGPNGYGKSFLRKLVGMRNAKYDFPKVASFSMEMRTTKREEWSALSSIHMDDPTDATSNHTCQMMQNLMRNTPNRYFIIDEPEIGMGKEVLLGYLNSLNQEIQTLKEKDGFRGLMIITHSEFFIDNFQHDHFINLEGLTFQQWKEREIKAISPEKLSEWSLAMWRAIERRLKD
jgi:Fe-S cluster assembly ATPase SufC